MKVKISDKNLKTTDKELQINDMVWKAKVNHDLVAQVVTVYRSNERSSEASTKDRGQVSGGGRKPWRQKGTGRARHGSTRSPIWAGGGVTFGPTGRNWKRSVNRKMKLGALASVLTERLGKEQVHFIDPSTLSREMIDGYKSAVVVTGSDKLYKELRNIKKVTISDPKNLNALVSMSGEKVFVDIEAVKSLEERFENGK